MSLLVTELLRSAKHNLETKEDSGFYADVTEDEKEKIDHEKQVKETKEEKIIRSMLEARQELNEMDDPKKLYDVLYCRKFGHSYEDFIFYTNTFQEIAEEKITPDFESVQDVNVELKIEEIRQKREAKEKKVEVEKTEKDEKTDEPKLSKAEQKRNAEKEFKARQMYFGF